MSGRRLDVCCHRPPRIGNKPAKRFTEDSWIKAAARHRRVDWRLRHQFGRLPLSKRHIGENGNRPWWTGRDKSRFGIWRTAQPRLDVPPGRIRTLRHPATLSTSWPWADCLLPAQRTDMLGLRPQICLCHLNPCAAAGTWAGAIGFIGCARSSVYSAWGYTQQTSPNVLFGRRKMTLLAASSAAKFGCAKCNPAHPRLN
jgi:hypothetical protein